MFRAEDILNRMRQRPFSPLRIVVSEGQHFDIRHPDLVLVGTRDLTIGFPRPDNPSIYEGQTRVALVHVVALEDLPPAKVPDNGQTN